MIGIFVRFAFSCGGSFRQSLVRVFERWRHSGTPLAPLFHQPNPAASPNSSRCHRVGGSAGGSAKIGSSGRWRFFCAGDFSQLSVVDVTSFMTFVDRECRAL
jgi:hypothetical protein